MNEKLEGRLAEVEARFNALRYQKLKKQSKMDEIDAEMARLQGEWRLIEYLKTPKKAKNVSTKANKLDIREVDDVA